MLKVQRLYRSIPGIRELIRIGNVLHALKTVDMIRMFDFELDAHPRYSDPRRLLRHSFQVCSQNGEDGALREIFRRIGTTDRCFVEIGVGDGTENNTAFLLSQGWSGAWIDGATHFVPNVTRLDLRDDLKWLVATVTRENIAGLFRQLGVATEFDLLSLDIDQNTYYAWEGLEGYRPRVVVVEYNAAIPPDMDWKINYDPRRSWTGDQNFGASLKALELLGRQRGYSLVGCEFIGVNAFFVRNDLVDETRFAAPFSAENHYEPPRHALQYRRAHAAAILDRSGTA